MGGKKPNRRARMVRIVAIALAALLVLSVLYSTLSLFALGEGSDEAQRPRYKMAMAADLSAMVMYVTQTVDWVNTTGRRLDSVWFTVYGNTLRRQTAMPVEADEWDDVYPAGYAPGGVDFVYVGVNGEPAEWAMGGAYEQFLRVACDVMPNETVTIELGYTLLLTWNGWAIGAGETGWRLNAFYPCVAAYDQVTEGFTLNPWRVAADPMTAELADYDVSLTLADGYAVAATGGAALVDAAEGLCTWHARAEAARDMALVIRRQPHEAAGETAGGLPVTALGSSKANADAMLKAALDAMAVYERWFGTCPIGHLTLVETDLARDSVGRTGLIELSGGLCASKRRADLADAVATLCAGQYFGVSVGLNTETEPWLGDTLAAYAFLLCREETEGYDAYLKRLNGRVIEALQITMPGGLRPDSALQRFQTREEYELVVVDRGLAVLHEMRSLMGRDAFIEGLSLFAAQNAGGITTVERFASAFNEVTGSRWDEYIVGQFASIADYVNQRIEWFE